MHKSALVYKGNDRVDNGKEICYNENTKFYFVD